jgi:hypothetical protein
MSKMMESSIVKKSPFYLSLLLHAMGSEGTPLFVNAGSPSTWAAMAPLSRSELSSSQKYMPRPKSPLIYKKLSKTFACTSKPESLERGSICGLCGQLPPESE